jgi:cytochrome c556
MVLAGDWLNRKSKGNSMSLTRLTIAAAALFAFGVTAVVAQQDPIATRKALMKANNDNARNMVGIVRGTTPFDAAKVTAAFDQWAETAQKFPALFPDNTKDGDTRATPAVWSERPKFDAVIAKFAKDVADTRASAVKDLDGLKSAMALVGKNCSDCHETFRRPQ